jgi:pilus assembly protein CpaB
MRSLALLGLLVAAMICAAADTPGLTLPAGHRAFAFKAQADDVASGFILPGSRVDIVHVVRPKPDEARAKMLLENVLVVAVDQVGARPGEKSPPPTLTVAVKPEQALKLAEAVKTGDLRVLLRPVGEEKPAK